MSWKCDIDGTQNEDPDSNGLLVMRIKTVLGKAVVNQFGEDAQFWTNPQFTCVSPPPKSDVPWQIAPNPSATNKTLLNGKTADSPQEVKDGDILSVGNESKGIIKLPFLVNPDIAKTACFGCGHNPFLVLKPISEEEAKNILAEKGMEAPPAEETPAEEAPAEEALEPVESASGMVDIVVTGCGISTYDADKVLKEYMPDSGIFDRYKLLKNFPQVAFSNKSPEEAEVIKTKLEAAHCTVELRPHGS